MQAEDRDSNAVLLAAGKALKVARAEAFKTDETITEHT
jgi:hypothetical protein